MNLDFINELTNNLKESNFVQNFIKELGEYVEEKLVEQGISTQAQSKRKTSVVSRNTINNKQNEILQEYAKQTENKGEMYFVAGKKSNQYTIYKYQGDQNSTIQVEESKIPKDATIGSVLRLENGEYIEDKEDTRNINNQITQMTNEVLDKQDQKLENFRKEGHLYMVEEDRGNQIYLTDITDETSNIVLEEVEFPTELISQATEGTVFQYKNGTYQFYSRDGFER